VVSVLGSESDIQLLPVARTAEEGVRVARDHRPNVVLMDIKLPDHDGLWAIEQIMSDKPCPIVVLSGYLSSRERNITFESLRAGAVEVLAKPAGLSAPMREAFRESLVSTVRLMSSAVVVRRIRRAPQAPAPAADARSLESGPELERVQQVVIGASTGGPELIYNIFSSLRAPFPLPVLVAQHTLEGFDESLAQWLSSTGHQVQVASEGAVPAAGRVLLAPADKQLRVTPSGIALTPMRRGEPMASVDTLFGSAARVWREQCLGILLTGMGKDGTAGMHALFDAGALTVAQAPETCVVASMPESACFRGAVRRVLKPEEIVTLLKQVAQARARRPSNSDVHNGERSHGEG
jgi:two-component system, chemotaxis family, protein-glutamate methylesterase/glutaminase